MADTSSNSKSKTIFFSACEASADIHCANLIKQLKQSREDLKFVGIGGDNMAEAGCELIENTVSRAAMTYKAFAEVGYFYNILKKVKTYFKHNRPELVVVCDSPSFNFHIAKSAKRNGLKTFFFVAPQLWAWAPWRIKKLKKCCDKLACILPFEQKWFTDRGLDAAFIGNPLLSGLYDDIANSVKNYSDFNPNTAKIALIPGSRRQEIESIWPAMQKIAIKLKRDFPDITFNAVAFNGKTADQLKAAVVSGFNCDYSIASVRDTAKSSDFAFVTSGSACLEVASAGLPMCIMYQSNKVLWKLLGQWLVRIPNLSLVNIIAEKRLVPEFMPYFDSVDPIYSSAKKLLKDKNTLSALSSELVEITKPLASKNALCQASQIITEMIA